MYKHLMDARLNRIKGRTQMWWGRLTHNRHNSIAGRIKVIAGSMDEKLSFSRYKASRMINRRRQGYKFWKK